MVEVLKMTFQKFLKEHHEDGESILLQSAQLSAERLAQACKFRDENGEVSTTLIQGVLDSGFALGGVDHSAKDAYGALFSVATVHAPEIKKLYDAIRQAENLIEDENNRKRQEKRKRHPDFLGDIDLLDE